jgi:hypothetical protein
MLGGQPGQLGRQRDRREGLLSVGRVGSTKATGPLRSVSLAAGYFIVDAMPCA